ncbi:unnamed protein product, partial [Arctogadus glacialis]
MKVSESEKPSSSNVFAVLCARRLRRNPKQKRHNPASPSVSDSELLALPDSRHAYLK